MGLEKINEMRKYKGIGIDELCQMSGVPKGTLSKITAGITKNPSVDTVKAIVYAMGFTLDDLDNFPNVVIKGSNDFSVQEIDHIKKYRSLPPIWQKAVDGFIETALKANQKEQAPASTEAEQKTTSIIYFDDKVSAGSGWDFLDGGKRQIALALNETTRKADYAVQVAGNSMLPLYRDGDILLVREQPDINEGEIGIFTADGKTYVKQKGPDRLISINDGYPDIRIPDGIEAVCQGKVLGTLPPEWILDR